MLPNIYKEKLCVELQNALNSLSEAVYISDLETYELVYTNEAAQKALWRACTGGQVLHAFIRHGSLIE